MDWLPKFILIIVGAGILIVMLAFGLKYFNLNFNSPQKKTQNIQVASKQSPTPKVTLSCPVPKEFCSKAQEIPSSGFYLGLGMKLPANTPILSPFDGKFQMVWQEDKQASYSATLRVTDSTQAFSAIYLIALDRLPQINGQPAEMRKEYSVKNGETMVTASGKAVPYRFQEGNSLVFYIYKGKEDLPQSRIPLKPADLLTPILP